jgi:DNA-directed RNA polymerase specialized sigma subunit|tara:strand:- start:331 stop:1017 length:687 start_codon:yes stop_codon:yes gene_type:complete
MPRKRSGKHYFTKDHENAILEYVATDDQRLRTELYAVYIGPAFNEMVDKIVYTYKFTNLPNIDPLKDECKVWLTTILEKYDPNKGSKAFSYFSVITKNWFIHKVKKNTKRAKTEILYDELPKEIENEHITTINQYHNIREEREFWESLWEEIDHWDTGNLKENEKKVLEAVKILLNSIDEDGMIYNKKAIYLYLRELTGLNTKQVVNNLNKLRAKYRIFKKNWVEGKI